MTSEERIEAAADIAMQFGSIDGAHHKQWVIDQMLRTMLGEEGYAAWVTKANADPEYDRWNEGIAP